MERQSLSFDRAADNYDVTRGLAPEVMAEVVRILTTELESRGPCLEIGVGTGRIALPLAEAGVSLVGIDLSGLMLARLLEKAHGHAPVPVAQADATSLPFADDSFAAGLAAHVLHIIAPWRAAVIETARVVQPGGVLLVDPGDWKRDVHWELDERFCDAAGISHRRPGINSVEELNAFMAGLGATVRSLEPVVETRTDTLDARIRRLEDGVFSFTWIADEATRKHAGEQVREWAAERFGSLEEPREFRWKVGWRAYDLP